MNTSTQAPNFTEMAHLALIRNRTGRSGLPATITALAKKVGPTRTVVSKAINYPGNPRLKVKIAKALNLPPEVLEVR